MAITQPVHIQVRADHELAAALRALAIANERTVSAEARRALRRYVADEARAAAGELKRATA